MSKEILLVVDAVSNEKGVSKDVIFGALEAALASAARKLSDEERDVRVAIDRRPVSTKHFVAGKSSMMMPRWNSRTRRYSWRLPRKLIRK